ncbi:MAG: glycoside hydrolase family 127 protein [Proteobacteria bacterium]|nr:glycoside hydrolase family 127 protein [Pseudomonadota bacterium]
MPGKLPRRSFLTLSAAAAASSLLPAGGHARGASAADGRPHLHVRPFDLQAVRLLPGPVLDALAINRAFLLDLDPDRLLHMFRVTARLSSNAQPLGGWEAPDNELRGHFTGHYLSACALMWAQTGDRAVRDRGVLVTAGLAQCQAAIGSGYVSAFPEELFDRLRAGQPAWAPFYTLHKIMAGLLDTATLSGDQRALDTLLGMAAWVEHWTQPLSATEMALVLEREYGGMNELLYNLGAVTADPRWVQLAQRFEREWLFASLAAQRDELQGLHVNTTIPQVIGAARGFEATGSMRKRKAAEFFWHTVVERRCYCTGGTSNEELWNTPPGVLAQELSGYTQESCVTYNMQKLARHVFCWTKDPQVADYYERAFYNGILGVQHPADGDKLYYLPLASGYWKLFGTPLHDFWCCTGSMAEAFAKLGDSIYFHDDLGVYVNLFVPSELDWAERGMRLRLDTRFPDGDTVTLTVRGAPPTPIAVHVRIPYWTRGCSALLNGDALPVAADAGGYLTVRRRWAPGDVLMVRVPMHLHAAPMPDDSSLQAVMYGPLVLAARLGTAGLDSGNLRAVPTQPRKVPEYAGEPLTVAAISATSADPSNWLERVDTRPLEFRSVGQEKSLTFVPLNRIFDERYAVYFRMTTPPEVTSSGWKRALATG